MSLAWQFCLRVCCLAVVLFGGGLQFPMRFAGLFFGLLRAGLALVLVSRCFGVWLLGFGFSWVGCFGVGLV